MGLCIVENCDITQGVSYFEFPTSRGLRKKWQDAVRIPSKVPLGAVVCSRHFRPDQYEPVRGKVRLKGKVVPTLLLEKSENTTTQEKTQNSDDSPENHDSEKSPENHNSEESLKVKQNSENGELQSKILNSEINSNSENNKNRETNVQKSPKNTNIPEIKKDVKKDKKRKQNGKKDDPICRVINKEDSEIQKCIDSDPNDIEEMITNYQIKNKLPNPALLPEPSIEPASLPTTELSELLPAPGTELESIDVDQVKDPVFIEVSVDKNGNNPTASGTADCLMLLESVQVDIDPATLMLPEIDSDIESVKSDDKKIDPISLLTSSDDDEVIIEEPHIDTVEVSDETDEDDMPLVKLVKKSTKKTSKKKVKNTFDFKDMGIFEYYCVQCRFTTTSAYEYTQHLDTHSTVIQICQICNYTTASKTQFSRHSRKHKDERKFSCHLCEYKARHKMSLVYHLESHNNDIVKSVINSVSLRKCNKCSKATKCVCKKKKYSCKECSYKTERRSDLRRHMVRKHSADFD